MPGGSRIVIDLSRSGENRQGLCAGGRERPAAEADGRTGRDRPRHLHAVAWRRKPARLKPAMPDAAVARPRRARPPQPSRRNSRYAPGGRDRSGPWRHRRWHPGRRRDNEKNIVLDFAWRCATRIEKSGKYRVVMTRNDDTFIPLADRVKIARKHKAALFVSIHADALPRREGDAQGATIYTLSDTASDAEAAEARRSRKQGRRHRRHRPDRGADRGRRHPDRSGAARDQNVFKPFRPDSCREMKTTRALHKHPLKSAGFRVLKAPDVPSVLLELGYVSNKDDLSSWCRTAGGHRTVGSMAQAVDAFFGKRLAVATERPKKDERWKLAVEALVWPQRQPIEMYESLESVKLSRPAALISIARAAAIAGAGRCEDETPTIRREAWNGTSTMRLLLRFVGFLFAAGTIVFLVGVAAVAGAVWHFSKDLPDYSQLQDYEPPVMTRVHAADGSLLGEYAKERRLYLPIQAVPKLGHQRVPRGRRQEFLRAWRPRLHRHGARRRGLRPELRFEPPPAGRLDHHPAGREELPSDQRSVVHPQDQGSAAGDADRAHLFEGQDPRTLSERNLSRAWAPTASPPPRWSISTSR